MVESNINKIAVSLGIQPSQAEAVVSLLDEGATVPFISRYRKEMTGSLDDLAVTAIRDKITQLRELDKRREAILSSLEKQEKLTPELEKAVNEAETMAVLEDIYLPYKPKRKTKASVAKEKGLEPLAKVVFEQGDIDIETESAKYVDPEKGVENNDEAMQGARDIIAEWVNEDQETRGKMRELFMSGGVIRSKVIKAKEEEAQKYKDYFEWEEKIKDAPSHRLLAMRRGEKEMFLTLDIAPDEEQAIALLEHAFVKPGTTAAAQVEMAVKDCYKRLLKPSMETETRLNSKLGADEEAIKVFADNLKQLLLAAPLGQKRVMAIDPGFRTGCKVVCLDGQGKLLQFEAIFPNEPQRKTMESSAMVKHLVEAHNIEAIAIGNGTASRETEAFVKNIGLDKSVLVVMVNESGASVYSASEAARDEFPNEDVTVRGAVSIGRRLMDPLAELVKIDPKSIGVGQYQHDVDQSSLKKGLDDVVESCVNSVGVELNTASKELLSYVSGLGPQLAKGIVEYRNTNGPFKDRGALTNVPRLGAKAFEQSAGFLRIINAANPLDASAVHPESYHIVEQMAADLGCSVEGLISDPSLRAKIKPQQYVTDTIGLPTLNDILAELDKPGRDPREKFEVFSFQEGVNHMEDLRIGMKLPGIVTNITKFGAFVDIGVHQDGLVHISHLSDRFVKDPTDIVKVQQQVQVTVTEVDITRKRIALSLKSDPFGQAPQGNKGNKGGKRQRKDRKPDADGDMQLKLAQLRGKFNS